MTNGTGLSLFGRKFTAGTAIGRLMDDLGTALARQPDMKMLGGGNPAHIPEVQAYFKARLREIMDAPGSFEQLIGTYTTPQGHHDFIDGLTALFKREYGWDISRRNVALTNGSQTAFFSIFNMLAGDFGNGVHKKILLPLAPEYVGYGDIGLTEDIFTSFRPRIEETGGGLFKYRIDFDALDAARDIGAVCVSRPTNPSGNVLTDDEIVRLDAFAHERNVPLIIDNAYGLPFPGAVYVDAEPFWNPNVILSMSLSKLGLPAARTGIVIAREEVIDAIAGMNAVISLAPGGLGPALACAMVESGEILSISNDVVKPYYMKKMEKALAAVRGATDGLPCLVHKPEGAFFLWLWFRDLPVTAEELYERLKARGVLVIPGNHFFPGGLEGWKHGHECIRITYARDDDEVAEGIGMIGDEVRKIYAGTA